jgi:hypothetical protein
MALNHINTTVATTPTMIASIPAGIGNTAVQIYNRDSAAIYLGDSKITSASGANGGSPLAASASIQIWLRGGDQIYAISAAGTSTGAVSVLYSA